MKTLKTASRVLLGLEQQIDIQDFAFRNLNIWPLVRRELWMLMVNRQKGWQKSSLICKLLLLPIASPLLSFLIFFKRNKQTELNSNTAFLFNSQHTIHGFNRYLDPIRKHISTNKTTIEMSLQLVLSQSKSERHVFYHGVSSYFDVLFGVLAYFKHTDKINNACSASNVDRRLLFLRFVYLVASSRHIRKAFMSQYTRGSIDTVFMTACYFPKQIGLIWACNDLGITSVDVQHGKQGQYNGIYTHYQYLPDGGYETLPDYYLVWGEESRDHIVKHRKYNAGNFPIVGGYRYLCDSAESSLCSRRFMDSKPYNNFINKKRIVLVSLQNPQGDNTDIFPNWLVDSIITSSNSFYWLIRMPNNNSSIKDRIYQACKTISKEKYNIKDATELPLYELLSISSYHITAYSSVAYEASVFGVRTMIFGKDGKDLYSHEIENQVFDYYNGDGINEVLHLISDENSHPAHNSRYINCSTDVFEKSIAEIL